MHEYHQPTVESDDESPEELKPDPNGGAPLEQDAVEPDDAHAADQERIFVTDSSGKRFSFPFTLARTWAEFEDLLRQSFTRADSVPREVREGRFDLVDPDGSVIIPSVWDLSVRPGWSVTMRLWKSREEDEREQRRDHQRARMQVEVEERPRYAGDDAGELRRMKEQLEALRYRNEEGREVRDDAVLYSRMDMETRGSTAEESRRRMDEQRLGRTEEEIWLRREPESPPESPPPPPGRMTIKPLDKVVCDPWEMQIQSARVYRDELETTGPVSLELVGNVKPPGPTSIVTGARTREENQKHTTWLHITRAFMNFREFEEMALFDLPLDEDSREVVGNVMNTIKSYRMHHKEWPIDPGTAFRGKMDNEQPIVIASIPSLHSIPYDKAAVAKVPPEEISLERTLREAFGSALSADPEQSSSRFAVGRGTGEHDFWIRQTWILVTDRCIFTYGSFPRELLQGQTISILDKSLLDTSSSGGMQVINEDRELFYIPAANLKSFFELKMAIHDRLMRAADRPVLLEDRMIRLYLPDGEELGPKSWAMLSESDDLPTLKVIPGSPPASRSPSPDSAHSGSLDPYSKSRRWTGGYVEDASVSDASYLRSDGYKGSGKREELHAADSDFILISAERNQASPAAPEIPQLNHKVPPFLGWLAGEGSEGVNSIEQAFNEGLVRVDLIVARPNRGISAPSMMMDELCWSFNDTDVYERGASVTFEEFEVARTEWKSGNSSRRNPLVSRVSQDKMLATAGRYFDAAVRTLESFVSPEYDGVPIKKYFGALSEAMKDPTSSLRSENVGQESPNPSFPATSRWHNRGLEWTISHERLQSDKTKPFAECYDHEGGCPACSKGILYKTPEDAISHMRRSHIVGSATDETLRHYLQTLPEALMEKKEQEQMSVLEFGADAMLRILTKLVAIQDGVTRHDGMREKRGLPHELLGALAVIVAFVCALSSTMHKIAWAYGDDMPRKPGRLTQLVSPDIVKQRDKLALLAAEAERLIRRAERRLMSPTGPQPKDGDAAPESFQVSVGAHYIAAQIVCNLVNMPAYNHQSVADLYEAKLKSL
ncbi:hypothetical protein C8A05DRAFT_36702, partial [Staphylotrichum tortipilum]